MQSHPGSKIGDDRKSLFTLIIGTGSDELVSLVMNSQDGPNASDHCDKNGLQEGSDPC